jgi:catechol 2,3-dioxygenase-like lactoylglutathione lyase family enzyme
MPRLVRSATYFLTPDVRRAVDYYTSVLGFTAEYVAGDPPAFAIVSRDGLALMLRLTTEPDEIRVVADQGGAWDAYFWVEDVDGLAAAFERSGATYAYPPRDEPAHGTREFAIRDPDGRVLGFGEPAGT